MYLPYLCLVSVISCSCLIVIPSAYCDDSDEKKVLGHFEKISPMFMVKTPLYRLYLEWLAENLNNPDVNSNEIDIFNVMESNGVMEKRDRPSRRHPALKALFIYKINRDKCVNLGDEGCINGSLPGSGSDSGFLNGGNNPGK